MILLLMLMYDHQDLITYSCEILTNKRVLVEQPGHNWGNTPNQSNVIKIKWVVTWLVNQNAGLLRKEWRTVMNDMC